MTKSRAESKRIERQNKRDRGLVQVEVWIYPEHRQKLRQFVKELNSTDTKKA